MRMRRMERMQGQLLRNSNVGNDSGTDTATTIARQDQLQVHHWVRQVESLVRTSKNKLTCCLDRELARKATW
jgi:hypothetical protein